MILTNAELTRSLEAVAQAIHVGAAAGPLIATLLMALSAIARSEILDLRDRRK
jgi:hypothetical protein